MCCSYMYICIYMYSYIYIYMYDRCIYVCIKIPIHKSIHALAYINKAFEPLTVQHIYAIMLCDGWVALLGFVAFRACMRS